MAIAQRVAPESPPIRRFTVAEVNRMVEAGILREDEPLELIEGELIEVTPQGPEHSTSTGEAGDLLAEAYRAAGHVRVQVPLEAGTQSMPDPDLAVAKGSRAEYRRRHPRGSDLLLLVEVAKTSQAYDRRKALVYARAGVLVCWILDLEARRLEVYRERSAKGYADIEILSETKKVRLPGTDMVRKVKDFLP